MKNLIVLIFLFVLITQPEIRSAEWKYYEADRSYIVTEIDATADSIAIEYITFWTDTVEYEGEQYIEEDLIYLDMNYYTNVDGVIRDTLYVSPDEDIDIDITAFGNDTTIYRSLRFKFE